MSERCPYFAAIPAANAKNLKAMQIIIAQGTFHTAEHLIKHTRASECYFTPILVAVKLPLVMT